ncbi:MULTISPECIES: DUF4826 family protein [Idiomarinaceae]|uniref:Uncharacterized protein DUF4826 n=4 Tax=Pseudidiomarina TaxID=2800384 RepID=A0A368V219_9GAMM|nr:MULTISPECIES: DUF4826 family protein [Idiomarinaceae]MDT7524903.1 DUF4826 family protein [Pseudidiomarina sp. GXY010]MDX1525113.1 DUF4826 family protein [Pseudidiomarina maritima]MRJ40895.1 DUF4826 family protein [Idiomarina sp. FeN1]NCU56699.1 DUF4826 family protein [Idiomarina sp. FenA--70]NCU59079.1 DUF4826 family protein [Idiomarina sp. FenBw--71]
MAEPSTPQSPDQLTDEQRTTWVREHFQAANKFLAEQGIITERVLTKESRYIAPIVAVWKFQTQDKKEVWVINGDVPTDLAAGKNAKDARDATRHFSLQWQVKAEVVAHQAQGDRQQLNYANYLVNRAEQLYDVFEDEKLWQQHA